MTTNIKVDQEKIDVIMALKKFSFKERIVDIALN
jgi:hypothetical protein